MKFLRRRKGQTDYKARAAMLKSGKPRIIFRKTNKYIIGQLIESKNAKDKVIIGVNSKMLIKYGWPKSGDGELKSITASYLTGFLLGKKMEEREKGAEAILDIGLIRNITKSRVHAFLKGLVNSGVGIKYDESKMPDENRLHGKHLKQKVNFGEVRGKIENE